MKSNFLRISSILTTALDCCLRCEDKERCFIKAIIIKILNLTVGKVVRLIQSMWYQNHQVPSTSLLESVIKESRNSQTEYFLSTMQEALLFRHREELWAFAASQVKSERPILTEFGVNEGHSVNFFSTLLPMAEIYGFDSFEGLQEDWSGTNLKKGSLDLKGRLPKVRSNVTLIKGWFEETVEPWLETTSPEYIGLIHIDSDTYAPANYVLNILRKQMGPGTIVIFDEYFGYPGWKNHEFKAWQELVQSFDVEYSYIAVAECSVAIKILS